MSLSIDFRELKVYYQILWFIVHTCQAQILHFTLKVSALVVGVTLTRNHNQRSKIRPTVPSASSSPSVRSMTSNRVRSRRRATTA